jgi:hypothetical protein
MSPAAIQHQIEAIQRITAAALMSKKSAKKILVDAGIMKDGRKKDAKKKKIMVAGIITQHKSKRECGD